MMELALAKQSCLRGHAASMVIYSSADVVKIMTDLYGCKPQENFYAIFLNSSNQITGIQHISKGSLASVEVDPRVLFAGAILSGCSSMILVHNHPSGQAEPSAHDISLTKHLVEGAKLMNLRILDHLVIARGGAYTSMNEKGQMPKMMDYPSKPSSP